MAKKILGMEIGNCRLRIAVCNDYNLEQMITAEIPDNVVREDEIVSWEAMADFIKETLKENKITVKNAAVVLPEGLCYIKRVTMPAMDVDQLRVNLPYEFHDYITEEKDKYAYDYAIISKTSDQEGNMKEMELQAVAVLKETVKKYRTLLKRAGLRLSSLAPEFCALKNVIKDYEEVKGINEVMSKDYAILDIGHRSTKIFFFTKGEYEVTRLMEPGCEAIDRQIGEILDKDTHIASVYKENNTDGILNNPSCLEIYNQMAIEIMRVLNFYNFNHPDNNLNTMYYCGGGSMIAPLINAIEETVEIEVQSISKLLTDEYKDMEAIVTGPKALGIVWE